MAGEGQKTEEPTQRRIDQAHERGEAPVSGEVRHAAMFLAGAAVMAGLGAGAVAGVTHLATALWGGAADYRVDPQGAASFATGLFARVAAALLPPLLAFMAAAVAAGVLQGSSRPNWTRVAPKWSKLSPSRGLSRLFGTRALIEFAKTLAKFVAVGAVALWLCSPYFVGLDRLIGASPTEIVRSLRAISADMIRNVALFVAALAVFDIFYQRRAFLKRLRMTLQELRDELKDADGDPKIKARIRAIGQERARRRMMAVVPRAAVVITNPTHYAVALEYRHGEMAAPVVIAKGVDAVALRIRDVAKEHRIPVVESPPLARALFASATLDRPIPVEHYTAVAEIIGYVLRLSRGGRSTT